jgi:hypothetical protein
MRPTGVALIHADTRIDGQMDTQRTDIQADVGMEMGTPTGTFCVYSNALLKIGDIKSGKSRKSRHFM